MAQIEFCYNGEKTSVQCRTNEKMKDIILTYKNKLELDLNKELLYIYDRKEEINEELTFEEIANSEDKKRNKMNILVLEKEMEKKDKDIIKSKNIICPECKENIKMEIKDYKINLFDCKNGHKFENLLLNQFEETQNIDRLKIICDICKKNNNNIFYKCLTCKNNICSFCESNHNKSHNLINYDDQYFICEKHNDNYVSYCEQCKINLCTLCNEHQNHKKINYIDVLPKKEELIQKKDELKNIINSFQKYVKIIMNILNETIEKINIYYKINENIISNFDKKKRNYETIYYLNQFKNNNNIIEDLR